MFLCERSVTRPSDSTNRCLKFFHSSSLAAVVWVSNISDISVAIAIPVTHLYTATEIVASGSGVRGAGALHGHSTKLAKTLAKSLVSAEPTADTSVCEEREHRPAPPRDRAVDLCHYE
jgi:hypothetical protein